MKEKYLKYSLKTLEKWLSKTETDYYQETIKPCGSWGDGMRLSKLPTLTRWSRLRERVFELKDAIAEKKAALNENTKEV